MLCDHANRKIKFLGVMKLVLLTVMFLTLFYICYSQTNQQKELKVNLNNILQGIKDNQAIAPAAIDSLMQEAINKANETTSISDLTGIVNTCAAYCNTSSVVSASLTNWLREDHPIYNKRTPTDVNQFRA